MAIPAGFEPATHGVEIRYSDFAVGWGFASLVGQASIDRLLDEATSLRQFKGARGKRRTAFSGRADARGLGYSRGLRLDARTMPEQCSITFDPRKITVAAKLKCQH